MTLRSLGLRILLGLTCTAALHAGPVFYAVSFGTGSVFGTVDPFTGAFNQIGSTLPGLVHDLTVSPTGAVYAISDANLLSIDKTTGIATVVGALPSAVQSLAFRDDGTLFGASYTDLYFVDPLTAGDTLIGSLGLSVNADNIRFGGQRLYLMTAEANSQLYTVNQGTGATTLVGASGVDDTSLGALLGSTFYGTNLVNGTDPHFVAVNPLSGAATEGALTNNIYVFALDPTSVPEPYSAALLGAGLAVLWLRRANSTVSPPPGI